MSTRDEKPELMLGKSTPLVTSYSPGVLYPIPRQQGREQLAAADITFTGWDRWHAYEMSWLDAAGKPRVAVGRFDIAADSPNMVESKSFKLYLNSLNGERYDSEEQLIKTVTQDIAGVTGGVVELTLMALDDPGLAGASLPGECIDQQEVGVTGTGPDAAMLQVEEGADVVQEALYSHLLRSLCPVTGQPDWATLWVSYRGARIDRAALLGYLLAFREHREFHEQCVERIYADILTVCEPQSLQVQACYTRRGGLDINPMRATDHDARPLPRLNRQ